jgi:hypothetical protein
MRALVLCALVAGVVAVGFFACNPNSIGRPCVNPAGSAVNGTQVSSPALECPSRLCLIQPPGASTGTTSGTDGGPRATCTATCGSDDDCSPETTAFCPAGFVCAVATDTGAGFCCRKICVCRADLIPSFNQDPQDGGVILPHACDPNTWRSSPTPPTCPNVHL